MFIPEKLHEKQAFLRWVIGICTSSQDKRRSMYDRRRLYYLFGQNRYLTVRLNKIKSHLGLVSSFLFTPDGLQYTIAAPHNADDASISKYTALQDDLNDDIQDFGIADAFAEAVLWSTIYDTMILKAGWNDITKQPFVHLVEPCNFGVFREDIADFSSQQAMVHTYNIDYDEAIQRCRRAGLKDQIKKLNVASEYIGIGKPGRLAELIVTQSAGENFANPLIGEVDTDYAATPNYTATVDNPTVKFHEVHIWDSEENDWRIFTCIEPDIILSDSKDTIKILAGNLPEGAKRPFESKTNIFLPGHTPFIPIRPYSIYNYFWGDCHLEDLVPLQDWLTERLLQIDEILQKQTDPSRAYIGFSGLSDEKFSAMSQSGNFVSDMNPSAKIQELYPQMPPDLFQELNEIQGLFLEQSGLTEVLTGKSTGGARGGKQGKQLQVTGGGRIRKVAVGLEGPLAQLGDLIVSLKMKNDNTRLTTSDGQTFVASQLEDDYTLRASGHSQSPLFAEETKETALTLFKAKASNREALIRSFNPANRDSLLHDLKKQEQAEQKQAAMAAAQGQDGGKDSHKKKH